jgi:hypothetical protein
MLKLKESDIQRTCEDLLTWDGWRIFRLEENFSERKVKTVGETGAADGMYVRYASPPQCEIIFIEWKRPGGRIAPHQRRWHAAERARGALTLIAGEDFEASIEGFVAWYRASGLNRGKV